MTSINQSLSLVTSQQMLSQGIFHIEHVEIILFDLKRTNIPQAQQGKTEAEPGVSVGGHLPLLDELTIIDFNLTFAETDEADALMILKTAR